ncbi:MAG: TolC family protein [Rikenellaceae bacterium]
MNSIIKTKMWLALLAASTLASCGVYSKYERASETTEVADSLYDYIEATEGTDNIASLSWQELFTDQKLRTLIEQALEHNTDLNVARLSVEQAEIALGVARKAFLPSLTLTPQGNLSSYKGTTTKSYAVTAAASWEIDLFGKLRNAKEQSKAALEQSRAYAQAVQTELIAAVAESYYTLLMLDEQLQITRHSKENWEATLRTMEALMRAGRLNKSSVLQSEASNIALDGSILTLQQQIVEMESTLSTMLGEAPHTIERGELSSAQFPSELSVGVPIELLSNRPDVRAAEYYLTEAYYATAEARSLLYPTLTLSGSAGYTNSGGGAVLNPGDMIYNAVASALIPIFNRGTLRANVKISKSQQEQALMAFHQTILDAGAEVNIALKSWQSARNLLEVDSAERDVLERAVKSSEQLMKHGEANYLEVLSSQLSLLGSELSYSVNKYNEIAGVVELYRALGGGAN